MINFLLSTYNSGVSSSTTSSDGIPGAVIPGIDFDAEAFILGIFAGVIITLVIIGIIKYVKFIIKDNEEMKKK